MTENAIGTIAGIGIIYSLGVMLGWGVAVGLTLTAILFAWKRRDEVRAAEFERRQRLREAAWQMGDRRGEFGRNDHGHLGGWAMSAPATITYEAGDVVRFQIAGCPPFEGRIVGFEPPNGSAWIECELRGGGEDRVWIYLHEILGKAVE